MKRRAVIAILFMIVWLAPLGTGAASATTAPFKRPAPIPLTDSISLLYWYAAPVDASGYGHGYILGEYLNTSDQPVESPFLRITLVDKDGNIAGTAQARPVLLAVEPGKSVGFQTDALDVPPADFADVQIAACAFVGNDPIDAMRSDGLKLQSVNTFMRDEKSVDIEGKVLNTRSEPVANVKVVATAYLPDGRYGGSASTFIDSKIPAGKTARFHLTGRRWMEQFSGFSPENPLENGKIRTRVTIREGARMYQCPS